MAGARAVPFTHDMTPAEVRERFGKVNGVLLPGGAACLEPGCGYYDVSAQLLQLTMEANDRGEFFPLLGTCLGFEAMVVAVSRNSSILGSFDAENMAARLRFTEDAPGSRFFQTFPPALMEAMAHAELTMENHNFGIDPATFAGDWRLNDTFKVLTVSYDRRAREYVSTVEARRYPILATQWHAEKNAFEWASFLNIPHSAEAVAVTQALANNLVGMARHSSHSPNGIDEELDLLIYNHPVTFTGKTKPAASGREGEEGAFLQIYKFLDRAIRSDAVAYSR